MNYLTVLGSTGSIGCNTLDVVKINQDKFKIFALSANSQIDKLFEQCIEFNPSYAVILNSELAKDLQLKLQNHNSTTEVLSNLNDLDFIASDNQVDIVMSAIVGAAGLKPTYEAIRHGKKVLLANKETLITGGAMILNALNNNQNAQLIPVDSEHSAIFQALPDNYNRNNSNNDINKIILTASGGPFRETPHSELNNVTPTQALKHPNWKMGKKISIDSATLMNKGLEVIEAFWLFGIPLSQIEVLIHPQSIIHSMVEYIDGSIIAQLGTADMKTPIAYALSYPNRIKSNSKFLDFTTITNLTFEKPDLVRFPCLQLAFDALKEGGISPAVLNAANEVAVEEFLQDKIKFYDIPNKIEKAMNYFGNNEYSDINEIIAIDQEVREFIRELIV